MSRQGRPVHLEGVGIERFQELAATEYVDGWKFAGVDALLVVPFFDRSTGGAGGAAIPRKQQGRHATDETARCFRPHGAQT